MLYLRRNYREKSKSSGLLNKYQVREEESDLQIQTKGIYIKEAGQKLLEIRNSLSDYIKTNPLFLKSLTPIPPNSEMPWIAKTMAEASLAAGVGPMAAVAGAIAEGVGRHLEKLSSEVIIENGGDVFFRMPSPLLIGIFAGESPLSMRLGIRCHAPKGGGICTSSSTVGHSLSGGRADAFVVLAESASLADAAATAGGNFVKTKEDLAPSVEKILEIKGVRGALAILGPLLSAAGDIELEELESI